MQQQQQQQQLICKFVKNIFIEFDFYKNRICLKWKKPFLQRESFAERLFQTLKCL